LAPQVISAVLALEVEADRTTAPTQAPSAVDPRDRHGESVLWPGTHRQRVETETWDSSIAPYVGKYPRDGPVRTPDPKQRWLTFVHNHAKVIVACDFFVVTATFRTLYVFVILELATRRIAPQRDRPPDHGVDVAAVAEALPGDHPYRFVIHDRNSIFSQRLDQAVTDLGVRVLRTPVRAPMANSVCERFGGTLRRECLDYLIPLNERHLKMSVKEWGLHYNRGRPHSSLGPGLSEPNQDRVPASIIDTSCPPVTVW
jgi:transposase InsO family protein